MTNLISYISLLKLPYLKDLISTKPINEIFPDGTWIGSLVRGIRINPTKDLEGLEKVGRIVGEFTDEYGTWTVVEFHDVIGALETVICKCNVLPVEKQFAIISNYNRKIREQKHNKR